jgi:hypothetical protein
MDPRTRIPALALLGLSCTDCAERTASDPIVGEWQAVDIDGDAFPLVDEGARVGWRLEVTEDHRGRLAYYEEEEDEGVLNRYEYYSDLTLDDADAPKYRITLTGDLSDVVGEGDYSEPVTTVGGSEGYAESSYGESGYSESGYATGGALDPDEHTFDEFELELRDTLRPSRAGTMILDCELAADVLTCERKPDMTGDDELRKWTFHRADE